MMESFLKDNLLELRQTLWNSKYSINREGMSAAIAAIAGMVGGSGATGTNATAGVLTDSDAAAVTALEKADSTDFFHSDSAPLTRFVYCCVFL